MLVNLQINPNTKIIEKELDVENDDWNVVSVTSENIPVIIDYALVSEGKLHLFLLEPTSEIVKIEVKLAPKSSSQI